jgi:hypothetical protein
MPRYVSPSDNFSGYLMEPRTADSRGLEPSRYLEPKKITEIICPNCYVRKLITRDNEKAWCTGCESEFDITGENINDAHILKK